MEISTFELYLILKLTDIIEAFYVIEIMSVIALVFYGIFGALHIDTEYGGDKKAELWKGYKKRLAKYTSIIIGAVIFTSFIPSTKQIAALYILPPVINNEQVQQLPQEIMDILGLSLEKAKEILEEKPSK